MMYEFTQVIVFAGALALVIPGMVEIEMHDDMQAQPCSLVRGQPHLIVRPVRSAWAIMILIRCCVLRNSLFPQRQRGNLVDNVYLSGHVVNHGSECDFSSDIEVVLLSLSLSHRVSIL